MAMLVALAALVAASPSAPPDPKDFGLAVGARVQAVVRILPAARVSLSDGPQADGQRPVAATVTLEDGSQHPAKLVEFQ